MGIITFSIGAGMVYIYARWKANQMKKDKLKLEKENKELHTALMIAGRDRD